MLPIKKPTEDHLFLMEPDGVIVNTPANIAPIIGAALNKKHKTFIGQTPKTFNEYFAYVLATNQSYIPDDRGWGRNNMPAVNISLLDGADLINWQNQLTPWEYVYDLKQRLLAVDPNHQFVYPIPDTKEEWTGWPPPYLVDRANTIIYYIPRSAGQKIPNEQEWANIVNKAYIEKLAEKEGKETYGWISEPQNMPLCQKKGYSINEDQDDDPENFIFDVYGNVNEMVVIEELMNGGDKEREVMERYYAEFPEWRAIVEPRVEEYFANPEKFKQ